MSLLYTLNTCKRFETFEQLFLAALDGKKVFMISRTSNHRDVHFRQLYAYSCKFSGVVKFQTRRYEIRFENGGGIVAQVIPDNAWDHDPEWMMGVNWYGGMW